MTFSYALTEVRGDWKWHRELWCLKRHYKCKDICHLCFANIYAGPTQYFVCKHITKEYMYIYICVCGLMFVTLRYTQCEEMRNFPRMTVAQWYLLSLKDYINPLCVSWLWIQWCGTKRSSKTWFFSDRSLVMLMRQSQGSVLWWSNIAAAWLNIILHTQRCGKFMSDCFFFESALLWVADQIHPAQACIRFTLAFSNSPMQAASICWTTTESFVFRLQKYTIGSMYAIYHQYTPNVIAYMDPMGYSQTCWFMLSLLSSFYLYWSLFVLIVCAGAHLGGENLSVKLAHMTREFNKWCQSNKIRPRFQVETILWNGLRPLT